MTSRRNFISGIAQLGIYSGFGINILDQSSLSSAHNNKMDISWKKVKNCFPISKSKILNLNSGSAGAMPKSVLKKHIKATEEINSYAAYEVFGNWKEKSQLLFQNLANEFGMRNGSLHMVRNTTEAINFILWGLPFQKNDEILYADWDYPYVDYSIRHLKKQKNIRYKTIKNTLNELSDDEIVNLYKEQITSNTKLIILTWITHREGRILPVKKIRKLAKDNNIEVLIDGAHVPGQIEHSISDIDPEYYATSLHKWFNGPLGTGLLYVNASVQEKISPVISYQPSLQSEITKFDYLGTRAFHKIIGLEEALVFLHKTGIKQKQKRLKSLSDYWISKVKDIPDLIFMAPAIHTCTINSFYIKDIKTATIKQNLEEKFKVHVKTSAYSRQKIGFIRVSPNIYCDFDDLDRLVDGIHHIASSNR